MNFLRFVEFVVCPSDFTVYCIVKQVCWTTDGKGVTVEQIHVHKFSVLPRLTKQGHN